MKLGICILATISILIGGCSTIETVTRTPEKVFVTQRPNVPAVNITIRQGRTTKQQIMNLLGQPDQYINSRQGDFMSYAAHANNRIINLTYIEKSGSSFSYVISQASNTKNGITIGINTLNNTVGSINIH